MAGERIKPNKPWPGLLPRDAAPVVGSRPGVVHGGAGDVQADPHPQLGWPAAFGPAPLRVGKVTVECTNSTKQRNNSRLR